MIEIIICQNIFELKSVICQCMYPIFHPWREYSIKTMFLCIYIYIYFVVPVLINTFEGRFKRGSKHFRFWKFYAFPFLILHFLHSIVFLYFMICMHSNLKGKKYVFCFVKDMCSVNANKNIKKIFDFLSIHMGQKKLYSVHEGFWP